MHYLINIPQNQSALLFCKFIGSPPAYSMPGSCNENNLPSHRFSPSGKENLHQCLQVGVDDGEQKQEETQDDIHGSALYSSLAQSLSNASHPLHRDPGKSCAPSVDGTGRSQICRRLCPRVLVGWKHLSLEVMQLRPKAWHRDNGILEKVLCGLPYREAVLCCVAQ